ncbi:MAG: NAD-dependent epimerase/dehydratase family protein [Bacteroidota bacterium]
MARRVVVTGAAGFIGMHAVQEFIDSGYEVTCIDNLKPAYGGDLAAMRSENLRANYSTEVVNLDLAEEKNLHELANIFHGAHAVIHLAAWPGVRQSQQIPHAYARANLSAFTYVLEAVRLARPSLFMFASSSSIYGDLGDHGPVKEHDANGVGLRSFYAATKWANEILAKNHSSITGIPTMALRFFTVYGEFGRPDMAYWTFLEKMLKGEKLSLYGDTGGKRNFTYVKDASRILLKLTEQSFSGYQPINIALDEPVTTYEFLTRISESAGVEPLVEIVPRPTVDVASTWADQTSLISLIGKLTPTPIEFGVARFVDWYKREVHKN